MHNYSGIFYRIWGVCGILFLLGVVCVLLKKPWERNFRLQNCKLGVAMVIVSVCLGLVYGSRIIFPQSKSYTGEFVVERRNSRVAPPLPLTMEYTFWNGEGKKQSFYLDVLSKKEIFPNEFEADKIYTVYYDDFTKVITKVEVLEGQDAI